MASPVTLSDVIHHAEHALAVYQSRQAEVRAGMMGQDGEEEEGRCVVLAFVSFIPVSPPPIAALSTPNRHETP